MLALKISPNFSLLKGLPHLRHWVFSGSFMALQEGFGQALVLIAARVLIVLASMEPFGLLVAFFRF